MTALEKMLTELGRLGTRYPGEVAGDFHAEEPEDDSNEAPHGQAEQEEWDAERESEGDIEQMSDEAKQWLIDAVGSDGVASLKRQYQQGLY